MRFNALTRLAVVCWIFLGSAVAAQSDNPVVVELYTSQGCSSCPPADRMLQQMAGREDIIPLALHVDYWDYLGWKDVFGDAAHTLRQRQYARVSGTRTVYTPQVIIGGTASVVGARSMEVMNQVAAQSAQDSGVDLSISRSGDTLSIAADTSHASSRELMVQVVRYIPQSAVDIRRGENAGHAYTYSHIVTDWTLIGTWDGEGPLRADVTVTGEQPIVVILQEHGPGAIRAAARLR